MKILQILRKFKFRKGYCCAGFLTNEFAMRRHILSVFILLAAYARAIDTTLLPAPTPFRPTRPLDVTRRRLDSDGTTSPYILRLNYGLAGVRERTGCIVDGYWTHTFHFEIPVDINRESVLSYAVPDIDRRTTAPPNRDREEANASLECKGPCNQLPGLVSASRALSLSTLGSIQRMTDRVMTLLPDLAMRDQLDSNVDCSMSSVT